MFFLPLKQNKNNKTLKTNLGWITRAWTCPGMWLTHHLKPLKKTAPTSRSYQLWVAFRLGVGLHTYFSSVLGFCLAWAYAGLVPLWIHTCIYLLCLEDTVSLNISINLWLLPSYLLFCIDPWALERSRYDIDIPFRGEHSKVSFSALTNCESLLIIIY